jgi:hypothetical protein
MTQPSRFTFALAALVLGLARIAPARAEPQGGHGPRASGAAFPSHHFSLLPHPRGLELSIHSGLTQPIFLRGVNLAIDVRYGRFVASYSHGYHLVFSNAPGALTASEEAADLRVYAPYSTGGGVGMTLIDELYVMADLKLHHFEASAGAAQQQYSTVTVGGEVGWRFFVWKGLHVTPVVRYWPTVWDDQPVGGLRIATRDGGEVMHAPMQQGVSGWFANVLIGWAFDLGGRH